MNTHNFNGLTQTLQSLIIASENEGMYKLDVKFHPDGEPISGSQCKTISKIERYNLKTSGYFNVVFYNQLNGSNFTMGHVFRLNFEVLKNKIDIARDFGYFPFDELDTIEVKNSIAKQIEINYNEFKINLACYNGKFDNYEGIAKFIIKHNAEIMFRVNPNFEFRNYAYEEKNRFTYRLNYKLEWYEEFCIKSGLNSLNDYLIGELKKETEGKRHVSYGLFDYDQSSYYYKKKVFEESMLNLFFNSDMLIKGYTNFGREEILFHKKIKEAFDFESQIQKSYWFNEVNQALYKNKEYKQMYKEIEKCFKDVFKFSDKTKVNSLLLIELCVNLKFLKNEYSILNFLSKVLYSLYYMKSLDKNYGIKIIELAGILNKLRNGNSLIEYIVPDNDLFNMDFNYNQKVDEFLSDIDVCWVFKDDQENYLHSKKRWKTDWRFFLWEVRYLNDINEVDHLFSTYFGNSYSDLCKNNNSEYVFKNLNKWKKIIPPAL